MPRRRDLPLSSEDMDEIVRLLWRDGVLVYPTDTLMGLGGSAASRRATDRVLAIKGRTRERGCPLIAASVDQVLGLVEPPGPWFETLTRRFWPGPLSLVLRLAPGSAIVEGAASAGTAAFRVPDHPECRELARRLGSPLVATSANLAGETPPLRAAEVSPRVLEGVDVLIAGPPCRGSAPSTLVDLTGPSPSILREGAISAATILGAIEARRP